MYESLTITLMNLSWIRGAIVASSVASVIYAVVGFIILGYRCSPPETGSRAGNVVLAITASFSIVVFFSTCVLSNNKWLDPNWRIALEVAKRIDTYVDANPGSVYDPDRLLEEVDKSIVSIFESVKRVPDVIAKLTNGKTMGIIKAEEQFEAFKAWQETQKRVKQGLCEPGIIEP